MMTDFKRLTEIIENRTRGVWEADPADSYGRDWEVKTDFDRAEKDRDGNALAVATGMRSSDAEFIATMGTLADRMLDVIQTAAFAVEDADPMFRTTKALNEAIADLKAACDKLYDPH